MQCQNTHTFDKVKEVIQILKTLDNGDSVDGETMEYILEQVGMTDQMLRQLIMNNPESETKDLLEEKISLNERRIFNLN
jgi:tRNA-dihydrouridine synthase